MDKNERKPHFSIIDPLIDSSESLWVEYLRGYHRGIEAQISSRFRGKDTRKSSLVFRIF